MINTIAELIEHMENTELERSYAGKETSGSYDLTKTWYRDLKSDIKNEVREWSYWKLNGMIHGLHAAHYISTKEADKLLDELLEYI